MRSFAAYGRLLAIAIFVLAPAPTIAQYSQPSAAAGPSTRSLPRVDEAWDIMNRYAVCVVNQHYGAVKHVLGLPNDEAVRKGLAKLAYDDCLRDGQLGMSAPLFRGAIYRALYLSQFRGLSKEATASITAAQDGDSVDPRKDTSFGDCVVRLSPDAAKQLVAANPNTPQEGQAVTALRPALADCLPPKVKMTFTPWGLQGTLAEAVYERTLTLFAPPKKGVGQ
ncbi:MAG: hypothetical protein ACXWIO_11260 [Croceibacterium sp.]